MGLPNINIEFKNTASTAIRRSEKGSVAVILKGTKAENHILKNETEIPKSLSKDNIAYLKQAFLGYINPPRRVLVSVLPTEAEDNSAAFSWLATQSFDWLVLPPDADADAAAAAKSWVAAQRENGHLVKAVLPQTAADSEAIVDFDAEDIRVGDTVYTAAGYCARIAGLIAGTPLTMSCTYAPLSEVSDVKRLERDELDTAVEAGKFVLFHDGEKVKVGRGVTSLTTMTPDKGQVFQKIKVMETVDMIHTDIRKVAEDTYIGKYANSYDNKCLLISAIGEYFAGLEKDGILETGSSVGIDLAAQQTWLAENGVDVSTMNEQQIKAANTGDKVFLSASIKILDAIEDINLQIAI